MRNTRHSRSVAWILVVSMSVLPCRASLAGNTEKAPPVVLTVVKDVVLGSGGTLSGTVFDAQGQPSARQDVVALTADGQRIATISDEQGQFVLHGLRGGIHQISAGHIELACRCWSPSAAPPAAVERVLLSADDNVQRGQRPIADLLTGPCLIALLIAAAIAIPIAIHNSKDAS